MLILKPPYYNIDGVVVFSDHANERQWYFAPANPRITTKFDAVLDKEIPQISLIKYRGNAGTGGFLNFDVNLGFPEEKLNKVRRKIRALARLDEEPILAPVPVTDGSVRLIMLGKASDDEPGEGGTEPEGPKFVESITHAAKPSLYGDNQAIFSVALDENGVQVIEDALRGELMPIGVVYSLEFHALRPAYNVSVVADWDRVQSHFEESFGVDSIFLQVGIDEVVDELVEQQVIQINVDTFIPEGDEEDLTFTARRDRALNDFKDMVLQTFFTPSLEPITTDEDDGGVIDDLADATERLSLLAATGGMSALIPAFSYKRVDITRIDKKSVNFNMSERSAVKRSIYPQAHLSGLFKLLRDSDGELELDRFIKEITLDDDWFKQRILDVRSLANFSNDKIASINLTAEYDGRPKSIQLAPETKKGEASWNSLLHDGKMVREIDYQYRVSFDGVNSAERPAIIESPKMTTRGDISEVNPRGEELYYLDDIIIGMRGNFPWEKYPSVELHLAYQDEAFGIDIKDSVVLIKDNAEHLWSRFRMDKAKSAYQMKVVFRGVDNDDHEMDWQELDQELFTIGNPRPNLRKVQVIPAVDWSVVSTLLVELSYLDGENSIRQEQTMTFSSSTSAPQTFSAGLINPDLRIIHYRATIIWANGAITRIPDSRTLENTIIVTPFMRGHRLIQVSANTSNFESKGVTKIELELSFNDTDAGLSFTNKIKLTKSKDSGVFEFDYANENNRVYQITQKNFFDNGMVQSIDHVDVNDDNLIVRVD
jgi:hypothetical protein